MAPVAQRIEIAHKRHLEPASMGEATGDLAGHEGFTLRGDSLLSWAIAGIHAVASR